MMGNNICFFYGEILIIIPKLSLTLSYLEHWLNLKGFVALKDREGTIKGGLTISVSFFWTDARRPVPRLWIRSAEYRGGDIVRRMGSQQQSVSFCLLSS